MIHHNLLAKAGRVLQREYWVGSCGRPLHWWSVFSFLCCVGIIMMIMKYISFVWRIYVVEYLLSVVWSIYPNFLQMYMKWTICFSS